MARNKYQTAVNFFERAEYSEAEKILLELYRTNKKDFNVLNFLGILEMYKQNYSNAVEKFQQVVRLYSKHHFAYYNLGLSHQNLGDIDQAVSCYKKTLQYNPRNEDAHNNLGVIMYGKKEYEDAERHYLKALELNPNNAKTFNNLGNLFSATEDFEKAEKNYRKAIQFENKNPDYYFNLADCLLRQNRLDEAVEQLGISISIQPQHYGALNSLAVILIKFQNFTDAEKILTQIISIEPNQPEAYHNLGICYQRMGENDKAVMLYQKALDNKDIRGQMLMDIGNLLLKEGKYAESEKYFKNAAQDAEYKGTLYTNLGIAQLNQGNLEEALEYTKNALKEDPDITGSHYNLSHALLLNGDFNEGWREYEWRKKREGFVKRKFNKPELTNLEVAGKTVYVYDEQGLGDAIQFVRYLPMLKELGAKVIFECDPRVSDLMENSSLYDYLVCRTHYNEPTLEYDFNVALLSLPLLFNTDIDSIPSNVPYLNIPDSKIKKWIEKLGKSNKLRVGIVWAGNPSHNNDKNRSCPLEKFVSLIEMDNVELYSLQKGPGLKQIKGKHLSKLKVLDRDLSSLTDTGAVIKNIDLVISVDTSVAHLAGALNAKVITILPYLPDWRWLMHRDDSPWYPSMTLLRQDNDGNWDSVIGKLHNIIKRLAEEKLVQ